ncbi:MAG: bifunctional 23S rRNA (guanine(2069)-N(7))-methyltransferase RlmK/23S rRNA (guanine(2445)-N(2))-methyltransferase RlmL [Gammaproteobacteria bacterium]|nr:bifunctional 23S rRNA (guanine(2069)-N(7))-methyltransferase RlmK/23S rRNA (guanine(2445)-N(2))-methyltransferase RlmL [Gammaproteobacteria bacterium]
MSENQCSATRRDACRKNACRWFATCPKGLESLLYSELASLGAEDLRETVAGCYFSGSMAVAYRACLCSRLANRILLFVAEFPVSDSASLHAGMLALPWTDYLRATTRFVVDFSGESREIRNTRYGAQVCKDAIVDYFQQAGLERPEVALREADLRINVRLRKGGVAVSVDFSGGSLHQRGYRQEAGQAPLKENLAAALLLRADWPGIAARGGALIDPMCGSGTLLLEGAMMVADIAPGLAREHWGFEALPFHNVQQWRAIRADAEARAQRGRNRELPEIRGYDADRRVVGKAQANIERAGLAAAVRVSCKSLANLRKPTHRVIEKGLVIVNPPYGERLGERSSLRYLYAELGAALVREFPGWRGAIFTSDRELGLATGLRSYKRYALFNGPLASSLLLFELDESSMRAPRTPAGSSAEPAAAGSPVAFTGAAVAPEGGAVAPAGAEELSAGAKMFGNRVQKNLRKLERWARKSGISCYRLYDADMPEYAVAIDRYDNLLHVSEYRAPRGVKEEDAARRLAEVKQALPRVTGVPESNIYYKQRQRQRGSQQYQRQDRREELHTVREGAVKLLVNLTDFLDTGLFLDHRLLRFRIAAEVSNKHFLNLFCYTATATVHAIAAGAAATTSVDMSATYLDWARQNLAVNDFSESCNELVQADCMDWLARNERHYDVILLDPPSFSNSKRMRGTLDVQRDHVALLRATMACLRDDGVLYFSNNLRRFKLDATVESFCRVEDISARTIDQDFQRRQNIHHCWCLRHPD